MLRGLGPESVISHLLVVDGSRWSRARLGILDHICLVAAFNLSLEQRPVDFEIQCSASC